MSRYRNIFTREFLIEQHINQQKSLLKISKEVGCDHKTVSSWLHFHELPYQEPAYNGRKMQGHNGWRGHGDISLTQFNNIRHNAKKRNLRFDVTIEDLWEQYQKQNGRCALSGRVIGFVSSKRGNASLDRIDSTLPYTKNNIWWLHTDVNFAKQSLSVEQFKSLCREVAEFC
jgi:AraC-like DNA-binding protein